MSFISNLFNNIANNPEVRQEISKAVEEQLDPINAIGERVEEAVKEILNPQPVNTTGGIVRS